MTPLERYRELEVQLLDAQEKERDSLEDEILDEMDGVWNELSQADIDVPDKEATARRNASLGKQNSEPAGCQ